MHHHTDFSVVVKSSAPPPKAWQWAIYRVGRVSAIGQSSGCFETMTEAERAGQAALQLLLSEYHA